MASYLEKHPGFLKVSISRSSIHNCLVSNKLKLYRRKYFLQICDPYFFEKMEKIIKLLISNIKNLFCFDECTGLQVLERSAPNLPARSNRPEYQEFEYIRHGTVSIFSVLEKNTGSVYTEAIDDHTSATITQSIKRHVLRCDSSETLHYICDNYSSHSTEEMCRTIAELSNVKMPKLKTAVERKQWLESPCKRIVFHFLPTHGSWLNPIEIWFAILQQKALSGESFSSKAQYVDNLMEFNETWNTHFAHPFKWTYTGKDLYDKVVKRLIKWLRIESPQLSYKFLEKQLKLMNNLIVNHCGKIKKPLWVALYETISEKQNYIQNIIEPIEIGDIPKGKTKKDNLINTYSLFSRHLSDYLNVSCHLKVS
jgi:transposase